MITLITGLPGAGKTTYAMSMLKKVQDRIVCFSGIPLTDEGKALGWLEVEKWTDSPEGALVVIDEAQRLFRPTQAGKAIPKDVEDLETHRHWGYDVILITQQPMLIHANIRVLVGRHIHIRRDKYGRLFEYEWPEIADVKSRLALGNAQVRPYKLDSDAHRLYKSTVQVQDDVRRFSKKLLYAKILAGVIVLSVPFVGWLAYKNFVKDPMKIPQVEQVVDVPKEVSVPEPKKQELKSPEEQIVEMKQKEMMMLGGGHEAPIYSEAKLSNVNDFPRIAGCVKTSNSCNCYTQKAEVVKIDRKTCSEYVENGVPLTPQMYSESVGLQPKVEAGSRN